MWTFCDPVWWLVQCSVSFSRGWEEQLSLTLLLLLLLVVLLPLFLLLLFLLLALVGVEGEAARNTSSTTLGCALIPVMQIFH